MSRFPVVLLLLGALLSGCSSVATRSREPDSAIQAERLFGAGEFQAAAQAFLDAADASRSGRDRYRLRAAESWREEGDLSRAAQIIEAVTPRRLDADERLRLTLLQAELALERGDPDDAITRLALAPESVPERYRARFHFLRARAFEGGGRQWTAASEYALVHASLPRAERNENARRIEGLLRKVGDGELESEAAALPVGHPLYPHAGRALTLRGMALPRPYARDRGESIASAPRPEPDSDGYRPYNRIAVLLPMHGPFATAAQSVRDGMLSAYYDETRSRPALQFYDTGSDATSLFAAYRKAVEDGAELVVGPLARESVTTLFDQGEISTPLLALNRGGAAPPPPGSVSFALAPEDEGLAAAERILRRGGRRVIAVAGDDEAAQRALAAFRERFELRDGEVVAQVKLPESSPDYSALIRQALSAAGVHATSAVSGAPIPESSGTDGVDAIFLAARPAQARLFAPQLRVAGIFDVPIVATSHIATGGANPRMDRDLDGIEFTELPWLVGNVPGLPTRVAMAESLDSARGGGSRLFAFGIDAFRLTGYLDHLAADPNARLPGATGDLRLDGFGQVQRTPAWARYRNGHVQPAGDGALIENDVEYR